MNNTKVCTECKEEIPLVEFYTDKRYPDGHLARCKKCINAYQRAHLNQRYKTDPDYRRKRLDTTKEWQEKNNWIKVSYGRRTCNILKKHHEQLKDDPDRLSCDFLKKIIGVDCK